MKRNIYAWGLASEERQHIAYAVADAADVMEVESLPPMDPNSVLMVGTPVLGQFVEQADAYTDETGEPPLHVLLFVRSGDREPKGLWDYYDGTVTLKNLAALKELVACPQIVDAKLAAEDVSPAFLYSREESLSAIPIEEFQFGDADANRPGSAVRQMLEQIEECRNAFYTRLQERVGLAAELLEVQQQEPVEPLVTVKPLAVLRWLEVPVESAWRLLAGIKNVPAQALAALDVVAGLFTIPTMEVAGATHLGRSSNGDANDDVFVQAINRPVENEALADALRAAFVAGKQLESDDHLLTVRLSETGLHFEQLIDINGDAITDFSIGIYSGIYHDEEVWSADSEEDGSVMVPLDTLDSILSDGQIRLLISTPQKGDH